MFRLVRFYVLTSLLAVMVIGTALVIHRQGEIDRVITMSEAQNIALGHSITNAVWHGIAGFLEAAPDIPAEQIGAQPQVRQIDQVVTQLTARLPIVKVKIYDRRGRTIYSSMADEIGENERANVGYVTALTKGIPASAFAGHDDTSTFSGVGLDRDIVETYLPLRLDNGHVTGVFELYSDVTPLMSAIDQENINLAAAYLGLIIFLYGPLFLLARRADRTIRKQHSDINAKNVELREARDDLEKKVRERTRDLENEVEERKDAEARLRKLSEALEQSPAMTIITDADGLVEYVNPRFTDITGYAAGDVIGNPVDLGVPDIEEKGREAPLKEATSGGQWKGELLNLKKDRTRYWSATTVSSIRGEGGDVEHLLITSEDITSRKQAEEELSRQRSILAHIDRVSLVGEMATSLAHELNQPLTVISGTAQLSMKQLESGSATVEGLKGTVEQTMEQAERASTIIRNMRSFARGAAQDRRSIDVNHMVRKAADLLRADAREHQVRIELDLGEALPPVSVDPTQIQQVLINLALNGMEAMEPLPPPERVLNLSTAPSPEGGVEISVYNPGEAIPREIVEKIFLPFFTSKAEGLGLGLCISRSLVEAHGGKMSVESEDPAGTTFSFTLPPSVPDYGRDT